MLLIAAGPVEASVLEPMIRDALNDMRAKGTVPELSWGFPAHTGIVPLYHKKSGSYTRIMITAVHPRRHTPGSPSVRKEAFLRDLLMLERRLRQHEERPDPHWAGVYVNMEPDFRLFPSASLISVTSGNRWDPTFTTLVQKLRRALEEGFSQGELDEARSNKQVWLERSVKERPNMLSNEAAEYLAFSFIWDRVLLSPEQEASLYGEIAASLTLDDVNAFFRAA